MHFEVWQASCGKTQMDCLPSLCHFIFSSFHMFSFESSQLDISSPFSFFHYLKMIHLRHTACDILGQWLRDTSRPRMKCWQFFKSFYSAEEIDIACGQLVVFLVLMIKQILKTVYGADTMRRDVIFFWCGLISSGLFDISWKCKRRITIWAAHIQES